MVISTTGRLQPFPRRLILFFAILWLVVGAGSAVAADSSGLELLLVDIDRIGSERLAALTSAPDVTWWVELEDRLLLATPRTDRLVTLAARMGTPIESAGPVGDGRQLFLVRTAHRPGLDPWLDADLQVITRGGGYAVVRSPLALHELAQLFEPKGAEESTCGGHGAVWNLETNRVFARQWENEPTRARRIFGAPIQGLVDQIDEDRWFSDVETLASYNRYSHGSDIRNARDWLISAFETLPGVQVSTQDVEVGASVVQNVLAVLPGQSRPDDWYIVGAHYDSTSQSPSTAAPGAEDNASGCAGVLEMARILTANPTEGTVIFMCYSGEEQGLHGSTLHAQELVDSGDDAKVQAVVIMDMIAYTADADLDCLLEANSASQSLIDTLAAAAAEYTTLRIVTSLFPFGSDHVPYLNRGMRSLLTIENDWNIYPDYHRTGDLPENLSKPMGREVLKMNLAAVAEMAGATGDSGLIFRDGFESGDAASWSMSP